MARGAGSVSLSWPWHLHVMCTHDDVIKWKHFPCVWPFVRGIHLSPVNSPHKIQWRGALMFSFIYVWIKGWVNNGGAGDEVLPLSSGTQDDELVTLSWAQVYSDICKIRTDMRNFGMPFGDYFQQILASPDLNLEHGYVVTSMLNYAT